VGPVDVPLAEVGDVTEPGELVPDVPDCEPGLEFGVELVLDAPG
jgi:hypothetical protein